MALKVIGAGFGRTGTDSMKQALEMLGFGPCHHMKEVMAVPEQKATWRAIAGGAEPDWDRALDGYVSSVDWPSAYYWRELAAHYPDAKILLTVRSSDSWYKSMSNTILPVLRASTDPTSIGLALIARHVFDGKLDDRDTIVGAYERNTREVQAAFGPDRLLTYELGSGWEPLCAFLDVPVPEAPYPHSNSTAAFNDMVQAERPAR